MGPSPDEQAIIAARDPELGQPVGKTGGGPAPVLLAKMSKGQEIELTCKAYKVGHDLIWLISGNSKVPRQMATAHGCGVRV
jgi:hypothetical protein